MQGLEIIVVGAQNDRCTALTSHMVHVARRLVALLLVSVREYLPEVVREVARQRTNTETLATGMDPVAPIKVGIGFQLVGGDNIGDLGQKGLPCRGIGCAELAATDKTTRRDVAVTTNLDHRGLAAFRRAMTPSRSQG